MKNLKSYQQFNEKMDDKKLIYFKKYIDDIDEYIGDEEDSLKYFNKYYNKLNKLNIEGGFIWRMIFLKDVSDFDEKNIGDCWTISKQKAEDFEDELQYMNPDSGNDEADEYDTYIIKARTEPNNINFDYGFDQIKEFGLEEEIRLIDKNKIKVISIKKSVFDPDKW